MATPPESRRRRDWHLFAALRGTQRLSRASRHRDWNARRVRATHRDSPRFPGCRELRRMRDAQQKATKSYEELRGATRSNIAKTQRATNSHTDCYTDPRGAMERKPPRASEPQSATKSHRLPQKASKTTKSYGMSRRVTTSKIPGPQDLRFRRSQTSKISNFEDLFDDPGLRRSPTCSNFVDLQLRRYPEEFQLRR